MKQDIIIKNMVCPRCITSVDQILKELGVSVLNLQLGKVSIEKELSSKQKEWLKERLSEIGFELLDDKQTRLINEIKSIIIHQVHYQKEATLVNFSTILKEKLHYDYAYLSRLFSAVEGQTIERFVMVQKVERIKELLTYDELSLSEIAFQMNYSSSAHLSAQFKKITGMTPSAFKKLHDKGRKSLDEI
ncbi:MAG: hypothetical protein DHS20C18_18610 [Saprospiraceae bacterium]|nr:MAG: hypothetical protein DHS20C18_18610 [Saprospiraceae bacterium]